MKKKEKKKNKKYVNPILAWTLIIISLAIVVSIFFVKYYPMFKDFLNNY